jgi:hypothetical protein
MLAELAVRGLGTRPPALVNLLRIASTDSHLLKRGLQGTNAMWSHVTDGVSANNQMKFGPGDAVPRNRRFISRQLQGYLVR